MQYERDQGPTDSADGLLDEIVGCPVVRLCREGGASTCSTIVNAQHDAIGYQPPEPWSGRIESAPILFLSSNPSIDESGQEEYPEDDWTPEKSRAFFRFRFGGGPDGSNPIVNGVRPPLKDGGVGGSVAFWGAVKRHAHDILDREPLPGVDYALSEVVHCKSRSEVGVKNALDECTGRYLDRVLGLSPAPLLIVLGTLAREGMAIRYPELFPERPDFGQVREEAIGGWRRVVAFMPHPNAHMKRQIHDLLLPDQLNGIRSALGQWARNPDRV